MAYEGKFDVPELADRGHDFNLYPLLNRKDPSVMQDAHGLVYGDRAQSYGDPLVEARRIAAGWSAIVGVEIDPTLCPLMLAWLKITRQVNRPKRDNLVDLAGYAGVAEKLHLALEHETLDADPPPIHLDPERLGVGLTD